MVDLYIALGLVVIVIIVYLLSRMKLLPKKSLLFVIGALVGVFGLGIFNRLKRDNLVKELEKREKALKEREKKLGELKDQSDISEQKLREMKAEFERQRAAYEKEILRLKAKSKEEKEKIDKLSGDDLHDAFWDATG